MYALGPLGRRGLRFRRQYTLLATSTVVFDDSYTRWQPSSSFSTTIAQHIWRPPPSFSTTAIHAIFTTGMKRGFEKVIRHCVSVLLYIPYKYGITWSTIV